MADSIRTMPIDPNAPNPVGDQERAMNSMFPRRRQMPPPQVEVPLRHPVVQKSRFSGLIQDLKPALIAAVLFFVFSQGVLITLISSKIPVTETYPQISIVLRLITYLHKYLIYFK